MRLIDAEAFLKTEIDRCYSTPLIGTCMSDNEYLSERLKKSSHNRSKTCCAWAVGIRIRNLRQNAMFSLQKRSTY